MYCANALLSVGSHFNLAAQAASSPDFGRFPSPQRRRPGMYELAGIELLMGETYRLERYSITENNGRGPKWRRESRPVQQLSGFT